MAYRRDSNISMHDAAPPTLGRVRSSYLKSAKVSALGAGSNTKQLKRAGAVRRALPEKITATVAPLGFAVLGSPKEANSDTLATQFGYFAGFCNPHVPQMTLTQACEVLFTYVRRVPKYDARKSFTLHDLLQLWRRWRTGDFDRYDSEEGDMDSWSAAIATLPMIRKKQQGPYYDTLKTWMRSWHVDAFLDWVIDFHNEASLDDYFERSTTVTAYEDYLDEPLPFDRSAKTKSADCYLWKPEDYGEVDQVAGVYACITLAGKFQQAPNKVGRPRKGQYIIVDLATPASSPRRSSSPSAVSAISSAGSTHLTTDADDSMKAQGARSGDDLLRDAMVDLDSLHPTACDNATATIEYLRRQGFLPSQLGVSADRITNLRCVRLLVYPKADGSPHQESVVANVLLWSITGGSSVVHFHTEVIESFLFTRSPLDFRSDVSSRYDVYPLSLLAELTLPHSGSPVDMLRSYLNVWRAAGVADQYAIHDLATYGLS